MEQHTWPRASSAHPFSSIPTSDYGICPRRSGLDAAPAPASRRHREPLDSDRRQHHCCRDRCQPQRPRGEAEEPFCEDEGRAWNSSDVRRGERERERHLLHEPTSALHSGLEFGFSRRPSRRENLEPSGLEKRFWSEGCQSKNNKHKSLTATLSSVPRTATVLAPIQDCGPNFASLPDDILLRIAGSFSWPNLWSASRVCRSWSQALAPLREAMLFVHWGKKFKHGRGGVARNLDKALDSFLKGAVRGCAAAMVDAGLLLWEMGRRQEGIFWYKQAAELGDPAGQCNLGLAYLQDPSNPTEAVRWFQQAALAGHVRAQYSLALCLQQGRGMECSAMKAARWYQRAAEGGSARAMYNLALCYKKGEGINGDFRESRKWMKRAALSGHRKAQFEHGLTLFAESDGGLALVFLELATRAGETAATHLRDALLEQLSPKLRAHAITCADKWQAKLNSRT